MSFWQAKTTIRGTDKLFSEYIRRRDGECQYRVKCFGRQEWKELHCSHFLGRSRESVRYDGMNADASCRACHLFVHTADGQKWLRDFKKRQLTERDFTLLLMRGETYQKRDDVATKLVLKEMLKELE